jgi:hypothetical protein
MRAVIRLDLVHDLDAQRMWRLAPCGQQRLPNVPVEAGLVAGLNLVFEKGQAGEHGRSSWFGSAFLDLVANMRAKALQTCFRRQRAKMADDLRRHLLPQLAGVQRSHSD